MKKGCGTKKMAKGGAVKVSPRKAMAMGKKPSGSKSSVKKYAIGGPVQAAGQTVPGAFGPIPVSAARADLRGQKVVIRDLMKNGVNSTMTPGLKDRAAVRESINNLKNVYKTSKRSFGFKKGGMVKKGCK